MADAIYVINVDGYIGSITRSEIEYARANGKQVLFLEPDKQIYRSLRLHLTSITFTGGGSFVLSFSLAA